MELADRLSILLRTLYEAASDPQQWSLFVEAVIRETRADCGFVIALGTDQTPDLYSQVGFDEQALQNYQRHFYKHDLVLKRFREAGLKHGSWIGTRDSVLPDVEMERSKFYNDYMRPMNQYHQAGANLGKTGRYPMAGITLVRSRTVGQFDDDTILLLRMISPHLRQGFLLQERFNALQVENSLFTEALENSGIACLAIDPMGRVLGITPAAEILLSRGDGLLVRAGQLFAEEPHDNIELQGILHRACQTGSGNMEGLNSHASPGGEMNIRRLRSSEPLRIAITPFHSDRQILLSKPAALVFIIDPEAAVQPRAHLLRRFYGLTPAEARLCDLLSQGVDVKNCAERLQITEASARFVLQRVFEKTRVNSQSSLMRLILTLPSLHPGPHTNVRRSK